MSLDGFCFGLALSSRFSNFSLGYGYGLGCGYGYGYGLYDGVPSTGYLQTCFCDLDQPSGLNSIVDNGWGTNGIYRNTFDYSPFGSYVGYGCGYGLGGFALYC